MGYGSYSSSTRLLRSSSLGYDTKKAHEIFESTSINNAMSPLNLKVRESRDSVEHPVSIPIILGLDVTGSMGTIPHFLVKNGLPTMMDNIMKKGVSDPQVCFMGIGDHECDGAPLQIGQFESSDALLDHWLTKLYMEGGGGGNAGESYLLAWFFAANYTATDHFEKRNRKGILFTIGDEPTLNKIPGKTQKALLGIGEYVDQSAKTLLKKAQEKFEVYHLHMVQGSRGGSQEVQDGWKELLGDNAIMVNRKEEIPEIISNIVLEIAKKQDIKLNTTRFDDLGKN